MKSAVGLFVVLFASLPTIARAQSPLAVDYRAGYYRPIGAEPNERLQRWLETPVEFNFQETPLRTAIERLAASARVDLFIDAQGLEIAQVELDTPITLSSRYPLPLREALQLPGCRRFGRLLHLSEAFDSATPTI